MGDDIRAALRAAGTDTLIDVWVVPGASTTEIVGLHDGALRVRVSAPPEGGRANRELIGHLTDIIGVKVILDRGGSSRRKRIRVPARDPGSVREALLSQPPRRPFHRTT